MTEKDSKKVIHKTFKGTVVSNKPNKTIVVSVQRTKMHPTYKKRYVVSKKYQVHDEKNQYKVGDEVTFIACRPISKNKHWRVLYR